MDAIDRNVSSVDPDVNPSTTQYNSHDDESHVTKDLPRYTMEELLSLRPTQEPKAAITTAMEKHETDAIPQNPAVVKDQIPSDEHDQQDDGANSDIQDQKIPEKKKKKKRSGAKNKKPQPTGFEEFYADPPITPADYQLEADLYHPSRSFIERIEQCIQRYRARRKLDSKRSNIFTKYMILGGVDSGFKAFTGGLDNDTLENSTAAEIAAIKAVDYIRGGNIKFYQAGDPNWVIDFEGVAKGFFSHKVPRSFRIDSVGDIKEISGVVRNFLNYVLSHNVCPEYTYDILAARKLCDRAEVELELIGELNSLMPGEFNTAASTLFGGHYQGLSSDDSLLMEIDPKMDASRRRRLFGIPPAEAERIFKTAVAFQGTLEQCQNAMESDIKEVKSELKSMEVVEIVLPTAETRKKYSVVKDANGKAGNFQPLGVLKVKHWDNPDAPEDDVSDDEQPATGSSPDSVIEEFWLEHNILEKCFIGMKFEATVRELNIGVKYIDVISGIYCSFFTILPSSRLDGWKPPVPNERPAPTVDDVDYDDGQEDDDFD